MKITSNKVAGSWGYQGSILTKKGLQEKLEKYNIA
jgi:hypothetical protein